ncbi:heterodisulfide reductase-related iron-sulfur binding cluster, partial [Acinetobacter baumannii]
FGGDGLGVTEAFARLLERAGLRVLVPTGLESMCCSTPGTSKGYTAGRAVMAERVSRIVREASRDGELLVLSDAASCTEGFAHIFDD